MPIYGIDHLTASGRIRRSRNADLRTAIQEGIDSGLSIASEDVFAELAARYAEPVGKPTNKSRAKRPA